MIRGMAQYRFPANLVLVIGILELACTIIYVIPRTAVLGAILMTTFLGVRRSLMFGLEIHRTRSR